MSRYIDLDGLDGLDGRERLDAVWYLQQRGELPEGVEPLTVDEISELTNDDGSVAVVRHEDDVDQGAIPTTGVVGNRPDAGPERDDFALQRGALGATYEPAAARARREAIGQARDEDVTGGSSAPVSGDRILDLDTDVEQASAKQANERIRKRRAERPGSSVHENPGEAELRDPDNPANEAEREGNEAEQELAEAVRRRDVGRRKRAEAAE